MNYALRRLVGYAERIMAMDNGNENKWIGMKGLLKRMETDFPQLITPDTCLKLNFEEDFYGQKTAFLGPFNFSQFIEALKSPEELEKIHEYIIHNYEPTAPARERKETLRAEDKLLMLYSALKSELDDYEGFESLFHQGEQPTTYGNVIRMPHFGQPDSERQQEHWEKVYEWLADRKWIWRSEVDYHGWVYACCGKQTPPNGPIVWHGTTAALAYIIRSKFDGQWDIAKTVFCLSDNKVFPPTFQNTRSPAPKVVKSIDTAFSVY